jgi:hypothetical protein
MNFFNNKIMKNLIFFLLVIILFSCVEKLPTQKDGDFLYSAVIVDTLGILAFDSALGYSPLKNTLITLESNSYFSSFAYSIKYYKHTDNNGRVEFNNLTNSDYLLYSNVLDTVKFSPVTSQWDSVKVGCSEDIRDINEHSGTDTIYTFAAAPNLVINEIFYCGSDRSSFYFYDQFVELYNASQEIKYLDGLILCRARQSRSPDLETNDFVQASYVFQFPGTPITGRDFPIHPGEYITIAGDAIDHSQLIKNALDLSQAEWEFYNPLANEVDNPAQNVTNALPERTTDFLINLTHNAIILADGTDWYYGETPPNSTYQSIHIPIRTVIDAVEYASDSDATKELTVRLDAGFAGVGMVKYSGKSVERRIPGFDTNNSRLDFIILDTPTPGY